MKTTYRVKQSDLIGALKGFPIEVAQMMVDRQVEQGNEPNIKVFQKCLAVSKQFGGFDWLDTPEGDEFWYDILADEKFNTFFEKYPNQEVALFDTYRNAANLLTSAQNQISDAINTLKEQIANVRDNIESTLIDMIRHRNITEVDCGGFNSTPVISNDVDTFTLNEIQLCRTMNGDEYILFEGSGDYDNIYITAKSMDIEYLIAVYEWVMENQKELFEE